MKNKIAFILFFALVATSLTYGNIPGKTEPTFTHINQIVADLCEQIDSDNVDVLLGICVGGLPPTALFAKYLENKNIQVISATSYDEDNQQHELIIYNCPAKEALAGKNILIVDDIADTGMTIKGIKDFLLEEYDVKSVHIATIYLNSLHCQYYPDYWGEETTNWVYFPWGKRLLPTT